MTPAAPSAAHSVSDALSARYAAPFAIMDRGLFSAAEFAAGFDMPVSFMHGPNGTRLRIALADLLHDSTAARVSLCPFTRSLGEIISQLDASPLARSLLARAAEDGVTIGQDPLLAAGHSYYYPQQAHIDLGRQDVALQMTEKGLAQYMSGFITALRRHWHEQAGHAPSTSLRPADYADHYRLMAADGDAVLQHAAWELRGHGHTYLWRAMIAADDGDITLAFEDAVRADAQSQFNGRALKAAFNQWFALRERICRADHQALEMLDAALVRCHDTAAQKHFATLPLDRAALAHLGLLPDGGMYLDGCVFTSSWYAGFDDDFTRRHLQHIEVEVSQLAVFSR